jgi:hypothetical protein
MNRKTLVRAALLATPLAAAVLYAALNWYRFEDGSTWVDAGAEAVRNPYLAYTRLIERMGGRPVVVPGPSGLEAPRPGSALAIGAHRLAYMTPERVRKLTAWVSDGGRLVVEAEPYGIDDPLLDALGVARSFPDMKSRQRQETRERSPRFTPPTPVAFTWPGTDRTLSVNFRTGWMSLRDLRVHSDLVTVNGADNAVALGFSQGEGRVAVLSTLAFLRNTTIGELDHARFGWLLAQPRAASDPTLLFLVMDSPPLGDWLLREAWPVVVAALLLIALWLARIIPRFGPLAPDPPPVRRSLLEHIVASGRFLWARGERDYLLEGARERVWRAAARRGISTQAVPQTDALQALARLASVPEATARRALSEPAAAPPAFVETAAALREIEARLERRGRASHHSNKKARP